MIMSQLGFNLIKEKYTTGLLVSRNINIEEATKSYNARLILCLTLGSQ